MLVLGILALALGGLALVFAFPVVRVLERFPSLLLSLVVGLFVLGALFPGGVLPALPLGPFSVYPMDMVSMGLLVLAFPAYYGRLLNGFSRRDLPLLMVLGWALILGMNFIFGVREHNVQDATNEFRSFLYVLSVVLYTAVQARQGLWDQVEKLWMYGAIALSIIAIVGLSDGDLSHAGRPLSAMQTLFVLQAFVITLYRHQRVGMGRLFPFCLGFFLIVIVMQHRSVWAVALLSLAFVAYFLPGIRLLLIRSGAVGLFVGSLLVTIFLGEKIYTALAESYSSAFSTSGTFSWRVLGWVSLITGEHMDQPREWLFGNTFGTGYAREFVGSTGVKVEVEEANPHNYYVQTLLRTGGLGLFLFLATHYCIFRRSLGVYCKEPARRNAACCLVTLLAGHLLFFIPYGLSPAGAIFLGIGVATLRSPGIIDA